MKFPKQQVITSLQQFKSRRDNALHEDEDTFFHNLSRFVEFCDNDPLAQSILTSAKTASTLTTQEWWEKISQRDRDDADLWFPKDPNEEFLFRYQILKDLNQQSNKIFGFGIYFGKSKRDEGIQLFRSLILRPFADELTNRLADEAEIVSPEVRDLQAVPLHWIPKENETRIFLSHKSIDKPLVQRYYNILKELGFNPWLDVWDMPAGKNLERDLLKGFEEACAAVFFITENFKDENYLATEVDYAIEQKREKGDKFAIITLLYSQPDNVPGLLRRFVYKPVSNDLEGFWELIRALPIELGPMRWKREVVTDS